jgi:uncharacterized protein YukE
MAEVSLQISYAGQEAAAAAIRKGKADIDNEIATMLSQTSAFRETSLGNMRNQFDAIVLDLKKALDGYCDTLLAHAKTTDDVSQLFNEVDTSNAKRLGA